MILNLIITARILFPNKVTFTGSRDKDVDIALGAIISLPQWDTWNRLNQRISTIKFMLEKITYKYSFKSIINMD